MILLTLTVTALFASPIPLPIARAPSEADRYVKFWNIVSECIQAEIARRGTASN